ncbi:MAG: hypothetical protein WBK20_00320 [Spirochaetota bacterium]
MQRILRDCFCDLELTVDDIEHIVNSGDAKKLNMFLNERIWQKYIFFNKPLLIDDL